MNKPYFQQLNNTLKNHNRAIPYLLIDLDQVDKNLATLQSNLNPTTGFRIVAKSLPSLEMLQYVMKRIATHRLMVFHQPFLTDIIGSVNQSVDILLGKPMPIKTATYFYNNLPTTSNEVDAYQQIQWLVDTKKRIQEYIDLAKQLGKPLRLNMEIDVGLHRGGFGNKDQLINGLQLIQQHKEYVSLSGLMGYDAHVPKLPSIVRSQEKALKLANDFYSVCKDTIREDFPSLWRDDLTFNGAGSPTINLHQQDSPLNDISAGSCVVKPITFDIPTLEAYQPACYIATPVLKAFEGTTLPAMEGMKNVLNLVSSTNRKSFFIYGGFWKADYCYPEGAQQNSIFGASTNQSMLNAPATAQLEVDDFVFLRPHQSEFVFLQFGNLLVVRNGEIKETWGVLRNN